MVELTDSLRCLYTGTVERRGDGDYVVRVPSAEVEHGTVGPDEAYRVVLLDRDGDAVDANPAGSSAAANDRQSADRARDGQSSGSGPSRSTGSASGAEGSARSPPPDPPVSEGEVRDVTIETLGDQGDGLAKVERGYVVIVPDADLGDEVTVEITSVRENVSFARVVDE